MNKRFNDSRIPDSQGIFYVKKTYAMLLKTLGGQGL